MKSRIAARRGNASAQTAMRIIVASLWIVTPLALVGALTWVSTQHGVAASQSPVWISAEASQTDASRQITVNITWGEAGQIVAPDWSGTVRNLAVQPGDVITSGEEILTVGATSRIAWHSDAPFYRTLTQGDSGDDVSTLNSLLAELAFGHDVADKFTAETALGVTALSEHLGAGKSRTFQPDWVVYLPSTSVQIATVEATVGAPAPSAGSTLFTLAPSARSARLGLPETGMVTMESPEAADDETLFVGDTAIELTDDRRRLSEAGLTALMEQGNEGVESLTATLTKELAAGSVAVPTAAIHTDTHGRMCVLARADSGTHNAQNQRLVSVDVLTGLAGRSIISGDLSPSDEVAVGAIEPGASCE